LHITLADIKPGSYIGTAAMPQADGGQRALEVLVFPEAARVKSHFAWDLNESDDQRHRPPWSKRLPVFQAAKCST
jgi:hypothetical protein